MRIPDEVREHVYERVRAAADSNNWLSLPAPEKSNLYSLWARDEEIGGVLLGFMSMSEVHRYIKDTIVKTYATNKISDSKTALTLLGLDRSIAVVRQFEKPPGILLEDQRIIAWSIARDWKTTMFAVYERSYGISGTNPYAAVLFGAEGRFADSTFQEMVQDAASRLGIQRVLWNPS
jgi:hypothetical protein